MKNRRGAGITLIELVIGMAILGTTILMVRMGIGFLMTIFTQTASVQSQRDAEIVLYDIAKEVRNAKAILAISSGTLTLRSLDTSLGYDSDTSPIFSEVNIGSTTYQYVNDGTATYLKRTKSFGGINQEKPFLKGVLLEPGADHFLFRPMSSFPGVDPWNLQAPYDGVEIMLEVAIPGSESKPKVFRTQVIKRSHSF